MGRWGGRLALAVVVWRRFAPRRAQVSGREWLSALFSGDHGMPYGVAIAAASWLMFYPLMFRSLW